MTPSQMGEMKPNIAFIGLGVMGQRMLTNMRSHGGFLLAGAWDPDAAACRLTRERYPEIRIGETAQEIIASAATDVVYVACPPLWHAEHVLAAVAAGKAVYCEKPLGVGVAESRDLVERVERSALPNAVNFPFARGIAADTIKMEIGAGGLGAIEGVDLRLHFARWPRDWQVDAAGWLDRREQGGLTREVVTHYVFLTERLFGAARLIDAAVRYPDGPDGSASESHLAAHLDAGGVPISVAASVGGAGPDRVEYTVWGRRRSYRLYDWNRLKSSDGGPWREALTHIEDPRRDGYRRMLDNFLALLEGRPSSMASFREALSVQQVIEDMLAPM